MSAPICSNSVAEIVGEDPFAKADEGTNYAQPAIFCASLAGWESLGRPDGDFMAGHSLGELAALVAAGALQERDGLELVALRGRLMQESGEKAGDGGMLALIGKGAADHASELAEDNGLAVANDNSPQQVVLSGARDALPGRCRGRRGTRPARDRPPGQRCVSLADDGRRGARVREGRSTASRSQSPRVKVVSAVTAAPFDDVATQLTDALTSPVRWRETMLALHELGAERFVEVGPGRVLTGLVKRTLRDVELAGA